MPIITAVQAVRTLVFYALFLGQTVILAIIAGTVGILMGRTPLGWAIARYWCWSNLQLLRFVAGLRTHVEGAENIPPGGCIIASKHQSDWDIFAIFPHTGRPAYIAKKELMRIPFFGWAAHSLDCIEIDRRKGAEAIPAMVEDARAAIGRGCRIVIYPEGTRRAPLAAADYRQGIARLYSQLDVPVVPVALNSGLFWGRNSLVIWPGLARARFLPPIAPGLSPEAFRAELERRIEPVSTALTLEAVDNGLGRPLDAALVERLRLVRETASPTTS